MSMRCSLITALVLTGSALSNHAVEPRVVSHGFSSAGSFHFTLANPTDLQVSTNLHTWTKLANGTRSYDDAHARHAGWRFYRTETNGIVGSNVLGYVKVVIPPGKMAILGNPFHAPFRLDTAEQRQEVFGTATPAVKISLFANGTFTPHTFDKATGNWSPALGVIRNQEGFAVENVGATPLEVQMSGQLRQGDVKLSIPAGSALVVPPYPVPGPVGQVLGIPGKDGIQIDYFNEETQSHQVTTFDSLDNNWNPKIPEYKPGRAVMIKSPAAATWTKSSPLSTAK